MNKKLKGSIMLLTIGMIVAYSLNTFAAPAPIEISDPFGLQKIFQEPLGTGGVRPEKPIWMKSVSTYDVPTSPNYDIKVYPINGKILYCPKWPKQSKGSGVGLPGYTGGLARPVR